jgi:hypothetical protein
MLIARKGPTDGCLGLPLAPERFEWKHEPDCGSLDPASQSV